MILPMTRRLFATSAFAAVLAARAETLDERRNKLIARDKNTSMEATDRKKRSEAILMAEGIPINASLPAIETAAEAKLRSKDAVAYRAMTLMVVSMRAMGMPDATFQKVMDKYGIAPHATPEEKSFIAAKELSQKDRAKFSWRCEAAYPLMWALSYVETLDKPVATISPDVITELMRKRTAMSFVADAKLRPLDEILDKADLIYRYRWALVDARYNKTAVPAGLNPDVALERHTALNWLIGYMDQDWDDVTTDT